jgi:predicted 3-demethylubiquinone-9 3-methyltransferase (glyoxalase superfamily)
MVKPPYPCLWFDKEANEAAVFYCRVFNDGKILSNTPMVVNFEIGGLKVMALNGGPNHTINPSISFFVYCGSEEEIDRLYEVLSKDGSVLMPLGKYEWTSKYAWVSDKYGVNWQLDVDPINSSQRIVPSLLFVNQKMGRVQEAVHYYTTTFPKSTILLEAPYPTSAGDMAGKILFAQFKINGFIMNAMSSSLQHDYDFTPGWSFVLECDTQDEIDFYWNKLGEDGTYSMCGWLEDKFGVSWQIIPSILSTLMADPEKSPRVIQAFLKMQRFEIQKLLEA